MLLPRLIPVLLIRNNGLIKTTNFSNDKYVGDPLNAVKIFNEKKVDEIIVIDIDATVNQTSPNLQLIKDLASECRMPMCYGGGIKSTEEASKILSLGVEKISISSAAISNPLIVEDISKEVGAQSVVITLDVKKKLFGGYDVYTHNGKHNTKQDLLSLIKDFESKGAGEIVINSIDKDGTMSGYDLNLIKIISKNVNIPITCLGGAGTQSDIRDLYSQQGIIGAAAGSLFVFKGKYRAVLITYPSADEKSSLYENI